MVGKVALLGAGCFQGQTIKYFTFSAQKPDSNASYFAANMLHNTTFLAYSFDSPSVCQCPCVSVGCPFVRPELSVLSLGSIHLHTQADTHTQDTGLKCVVNT